LRLHTIEGDGVSLEVDLDTGVITQIVDRVANIKHLLSRRPELETRRPGMGVVILQPYFCSSPKLVSLGDREASFECPEGNPRISWRISLEGGRARLYVEVRNHSSERVRSRIRVAIYSACCRGGFWGDPGVEGATYSCRYYVSYGFEGDRDTFSSAMVPGRVRGYRFEKHSYRSRSFPEFEWIAIVDRALKAGLLIRALTRGVYAITEDQFFNVEVNIVLPERELSQGEGASLEIEAIPLRGVERVDYASEELVASVESPSIALPNEHYEGSIKIYALRDLECSVRGFIEYDRNMASIGKRGYCIDQVPRGIRRGGLDIERGVLTAPRGSTWESRFRSRERISYSMEHELYEIPAVVFEICGGKHVVRRYFTVQPEAAEVLKRIPESVREKIYTRYVYENPYIESDYDDASALRDIYTYIISRPPRLKKIFRETLEGISIPKGLEGAVEGYLRARGVREQVERALRTGGDKIAMLSINPLDIIYLYLIDKRGAYIDLLKEIFRRMVEHWFSEDLVGYYTAIHGGGGASRFLHYVVALDLLDRAVEGGFRDEVAYVLNEIGREIYKMTNVWAGNWEFSEAAGLLAIALKVDSSESDAFREKALTVLRTLQYTFLEDGGSVELAAGYHHYDLDSIVSAAEILYYSGDSSLYSLELGGEPLIKKALNWLWSIATPYDTTPALEDTNEAPIPPDLYIIGYLRYRDPALGYIGKRLWKSYRRLSSPLSILAMLLSGENPLEGDFKPYHRERVRALDPSGRLVYRESEDPGSLYIVIDYGPHGGWHGHPDKLSFEVYWRGEPIIVDAGSGGYYSPTHWTWHRKTIAHNTVSRGEEDHRAVRGFLRSLDILERGFRAELEARVYEDAALKRVFEYADRGGYKEIYIRDTVEGSGEFRWNLHVRGTCEERGGSVKCRTEKTAVEVISQHGGGGWVIGRGLRGASEATSYIYTSKQIQGLGEFAVRILLS